MPGSLSPSNVREPILTICGRSAEKGDLTSTMLMQSPWIMMGAAGASDRGTGSGRLLEQIESSLEKQGGP